MNRTQVLILSALVACLAAACGQAPGTGGADGVLRLRTHGLVEGVAGVQYELECDSGQSAQEYIRLEAEGLPEHLSQEQAGASFADLFQVLPAGSCLVTATAMEGPEQPNERCQRARAEVDIQPGQTTEVLLGLTCQGDNGGVDVVTVINTAPQITQVTLDQESRVAACTPISLRVEATDADGDALDHSFQVEPPPVRALYDLEAEGDTATLLAQTPGTYTVISTVSDGLSQDSTRTTIQVLEGEQGCLPR
jgi:hypothetical protein